MSQITSLLHLKPTKPPYFTQSRNQTPSRVFKTPALGPLHLLFSRLLHFVPNVHITHSLTSLGNLLSCHLLIRVYPHNPTYNGNAPYIPYPSALLYILHSTFITPCVAFVFSLPQVECLISENRDFCLVLCCCIPSA